MNKQDKRNFNYIKNAFDEENITAPKSLDEETIKAKIPIQHRSTLPKKTSEATAFKGICVAVACLILAVGIGICSPYLSGKNNEHMAKKPVQEIVVAKAVPNFSDYDEVYGTISKIAANQETSDKEYSFQDILKDGSGERTETSKSDTASASYGETYCQVNAVDEGDIIKNDGKYIYYVHDNEIKIFQGKNGKTKDVATIKNFTIPDDDNHYEYILDIYVNGTNLIINTEKTEFDQKDDYTVTSMTYLYDLTDISTPKQVKTYGQSGNYVSSRMIDTELYLVSNYGCSNITDKENDILNYAPYTCNQNGKKDALEAKDIYTVDDPQKASYLVISAISTETGTKTTDSKAILGAATDIYCNENNMYIVDNQNYHLRDTVKEAGADTPTDTDQTQVIKVVLKEGKITFATTGTVKGKVNDQFSLDEKDGYLRIATTSTNEKNVDTNNIFVLDENLNTVGKITGFAENESIKAVRYINNTAYVITYKDIDPLFIVDLSQPKEPKITGSVEITGFSSLLVPINNDTLLGIGYSTGETAENEETDGIKLVLFDISNPEKPKVLSDNELKDCFSEAQYNHKALVANNEVGYYAIPYDSYNRDWSPESSGAVTFEIDDAEIKVTNKFKLNNNQSATRCTYIGNYLYIVDYNGNIHSFPYSH